jgi:transposase
MKIASEELRNADMVAYKMGQFTQHQLADVYDVHYKTIYNWVKAEEKRNVKFRENTDVVLEFSTKRKNRR